MPRKSTIARKMSIQKRLHGMDQFQADAIDPEKERMKRQYRWVKRFFPLFSPLGRVHQVWDFISIFAIMYSVHVNLFEICWSTENPAYPRKWKNITLDVVFDNKIFAYLEYFLLFFFLMDVLFNFLTAFYDEDGVLVWNRGQIAMEYLKGWFWIDVIDLGTNTYVLANGSAAVTMPPIKFLRISKILRVLSRWVMLGYDPHKLQIFKMFILLITVGNLLACMWYKIAQTDMHGEDSWTTLYLPDDLQVDVDGNQTAFDAEFDAEIDSKKVYAQYLSAAYFAFATLTTVGYGDISAHTNNERILALAALMIGNAIFAAIIGTMASLFNKEDVKDTLYQSRLQEINGFMKHHRLPPNLRQRIRDYFELGHRVHVEDEQMKQWIPSVLMREVMITIHADLCEVVPFLAEAGRTITGMLMEHMHNLVYVEGEYIMIEAELVTSIKIIKSGNVQQISHYGKLVKTLPKGGYFGDECIKTLTCPSTWNYRAKTDVEILSIEQDYFELMLDAFPDFSLIFEELTESRREYDQEAASKAEKFEKAMAKTGVSERPQTPPPGRRWRSKGDEAFVTLKRSKTDGAGGFDESLKEAHENAIKDAIKSAIVEKSVEVSVDQEGRASLIANKSTNASKDEELEKIVEDRMHKAEQEAMELAATLRRKEQAELKEPKKHLFSAGADPNAVTALRPRSQSGGARAARSGRSGRSGRVILDAMESGQEWDMSAEELHRQRTALNLVERSGRRSSNISGRVQPMDMSRKGSVQMGWPGVASASGGATDVRLAAIEGSIQELTKGTTAMMEKIMARLDSIEAGMASAVSSAAASNNNGPAASNNNGLTGNLDFDKAPR